MGLLFSLQLSAGGGDSRHRQSDTKGLCHMGEQLLLSGFFPVSADSIHCRGIFSAASLHPAPRQETPHRQPVSGLSAAGRTPLDAGRTCRHRKQPHRHLFRYACHCVQCCRTGAAACRHTGGTASRLPAGALYHSDRRGTGSPVPTGRGLYPQPLHGEKPQRTRHGRHCMPAAPKPAKH